MADEQARDEQGKFAPAEAPAPEAEDWVAKLQALKQEQAKAEYEALVARKPQEPLQVPLAGLETSRGSRPEPGLGRPLEANLGPAAALDDDRQDALLRQAKAGTLRYRP